MTDQELQARIQKAVDQKLSGVQDDPWLAQRVMNRMKEEEPVMKKKISLSLVFVIVGILLAGTALATAITTNFFSRVFGNETRENVEAHTEVFDNGKGGTYEVVYPGREYIAADDETIAALIGDRVMKEPVAVTMDDHTLTILSAVRDENAMALEMTLECPTGVKGLNYDRLTNEGKGAWFADDAGYFFIVDRAAEMMYVDMQNSTENCLRIYYYCVFFEKLADGESPLLTAGTVTAGPGPEDREFDMQEVRIPADKAVGALRFAAEDGREIELSPISLKISGIPESEGELPGMAMAPNGKEGTAAEVNPEDEEAADADLPETVIVLQDPGELNTIEAVYGDGTVFTVADREKNIDNTMYMCGGLGADAMDTTMVLNRLVNAEKVETIRVNGTEFTRKN